MSTGDMTNEMQLVMTYVVKGSIDAETSKVQKNTKAQKENTAAVKDSIAEENKKARAERDSAQRTDLLATNKRKLTEAIRRGDAATREYGASIGATGKGLKGLQEPLAKVGALTSGAAGAFGGLSGTGGQAVAMFANMAGVIGTTGVLGVGLAALGFAISYIISEYKELSERVKTATTDLEGQGKAYQDLVDKLQIMQGRVTESQVNVRKIDEELAAKREKIAENEKRAAQARIDLNGLLLDKLDEETLKLNEQVVVLNGQKRVIKEIEAEKEKDAEVDRLRTDAMARSAKTAARNEELWKDALARRILEQNDANQLTLDTFNELAGGPVLGFWSGLNSAISDATRTTEDITKATKEYWDEMDRGDRIAALQNQGANAFGGVFGFGNLIAGSGYLDPAQTAPRVATSQGGSRVGVSSGLTSMGGDIVSNLAGPGAAAGLSAAMAGGGATAAIGAVASSVGPQIAVAIGAAIAAAIATAASAPFIVAGGIAGKLFTEGVINKVTGIGDAIFDAVLAEKPVEKIREYIGQAFEQFQNIGQFIGPVLDEVVNALPLLMEKGAMAILTSLVQILDRTPDLMNSIVAGLGLAFNKFMEYMPTLLKKLLPVLLQSLIYGVIASGAIAAAIGPLGFALSIAIVAGLSGALLNAMQDGTMWDTIGKVWTTTMATVFAASMSPVIGALNNWIQTVNTAFGLSIPKIPVPEFPGYASDASAYSIGGTDETSGGGSTNPTMPNRNDLPVFHTGGYVDSIMAANQSRAGNVLAMLRPGEGVLTPEATAKAGGPQGIADMNAGRTAMGRVEITINLVGHTVETARVMIRDVLLPEMSRIGYVNATSLSGHSLVMP